MPREPGYREFSPGDEPVLHRFGIKVQTGAQTRISPIPRATSSASTSGGTVVTGSDCAIGWDTGSLALDRFWSEVIGWPSLTSRMDASPRA